MSLLIWCPFNGNLNSQGFKSAAWSVYNGSVGTYSAGKITLNSLQLGTGTLSIPNPLIGATNWTIAFWYKANSPGTWSDIFTCASNSQRVEFSAASGARLHWYQTGVFTSGTQLADGLSNSTWYHIVITFDNGTSTFYLDGVQKVQQTGRSTWASAETPIYFGSRINTTYCAVNLNDLRIYDHTLSLKEIKELSRGLSIHYKFNFEDLYQPVEYLQSNGSQYIDTNITPYSNYTIEGEFYAPTIDGGTFFFGSGASYNDRNLELYGNSSSSLEIHYSNYYQLSTNYAGKWFKYYQEKNNITISVNNSVTDTYSFSATTFYCPYTMYIFALHRSSVLTTGQAVRCKYFKLINNGVVIRHFIPCVRRSDGTAGMFDLVDGKFYTNAGSGTFTIPSTTIVAQVPDASGYGNNATYKSACSTTNSTPVGSTSLVCPSTGVCVPYTLPMQKYTIAMWFRLGATGKMPLGSNTTSSSNTNFYCFGDNSWKYVTSAGSQEYYYPHNGGAVSTSDYVFWVATYDGTNTKIYRNGVYEGSQAVTTAGATITFNSISIGFGYSDSSYWTTNQVAEFRLYATALSQTDITELYKARESVDKKGNIYCNTFYEDTTKSNIDFTKKGIITTKDFTEVMTLSDGSTWLPICIHYVPNGVFANSGDFTTFNYQDYYKWTNFGIIKSADRPESGYYEFLCMHQTSVGGAFKSYRWKQDTNPFNATWADVNPSVSGTSGTKVIWLSPTSAASGGMYWFNQSNCKMCFANSSNGNWFGCGICSLWGTTYIPSYNNEQCWGYQLVYMRVKSNKGKLLKNYMVEATELKEN